MDLFIFYFILTNFSITSAQLKTLTKSCISLIDVNFLRYLKMCDFTRVVDVHLQAGVHNRPSSR